jgi:Glutamate-1-semialdehyde aminotransferase
VFRVSGPESSLMAFNQSHKLFQAAKKLFPGGVNSPVRAFASVG